MKGLLFLTGKHTLFDIACSNLNAAKWIYYISSDDPLGYNSVAYHVEQAVEAGLKYVLELYGCDCEYIRDIEKLLRMAKDIGVSLVLSSETENTLLISSISLTAWGNKGVCDKNWLVSEQTVRYGFKLANSLLSEIAEWDGLDYCPLSLS